MKVKTLNLLKNPLIAGSFFLFSGGMLANVFNFLFNLLMSRNLIVAEYGTLSSIISLITLLGIPAGAVTPLVVSIAGKYYVEGNNKLLHAFYFRLFRPLVISGAIIYVLFLIFSKQLGEFFNIGNIFLLSVVMLSVVLSYVTTLNNSFAQAKLSFRYLSFSSSASSFIKVSMSFFLVISGWGLTGALFGFLASLIFPLILGIIYLRKTIFFKSVDIPHISYRQLISVGIPSAVTVFSLNALISTDILLVKYLFNSFQTGQYAGLSLVGRVIFYISAPISTVMFPVVINRINKGGNYKNILYLSTLLVGSGSLFITVFYYLFPEFSIMFFLKRTEYLEMAQFIGRFGVFTTLYALLSLLAYYLLSIKQTLFSWILLVGSIVQAILILFFHNDFGQIINISTIVSLALLLLAFYFFHKAKN